MSKAHLITIDIARVSQMKRLFCRLILITECIVVAKKFVQVCIDEYDESSDSFVCDLV